MEKIKTIDEHGSKMDFQNEKLKKLYVNYSNAFDAVGIHAAQNARMQFSRDEERAMITFKNLLLIQFMCKKESNGYVFHTNSRPILPKKK